MWISKSEYDEIKYQESNVVHKAALWDAITDALHDCRFDKSKPGVMISENIYVISSDTFNDILSRLAKANEQLLSITAERDWYKNAFADLKCKLGESHEILD